MLIDIHCRNFVLTDALEEYVHKRLGFTLSRASSEVRRVDVTLSDLNGPRGGIDKRCLVQVKLDGLMSVVVEDVQSDLYTAINRAAGRAGRTVMRRLALNSNRRRMTVAHQSQRWLPSL